MSHIPTKTIALVDLWWSGHHSAYFKMFAQTILSHGCNVLAFCPEPEEVRSWIDENCPEYAQMVHFSRVQDPEPSSVRYEPLQALLTTINRWRFVNKQVRIASGQSGCSPALVFFAYFDYFYCSHLPYQLVNRISDYPWSGLFFNPRSLDIPPGTSYFTRFLAGHNLFKSDRCSSIAILDEGYIGRVSEYSGGKRGIVFPDVTDESMPDDGYPIAKRITEKAAGRKVVGLIGSLDRRKGLKTLLEVAQKMQNEEYFFAFCGKFHESTFRQEELIFIRSVVASAPENCFFHLEKIPDEPQFNALIAALDVVSAAYEDFYHSSNLLTKAALFKKHVIVSKGYCMEERVKKFDLGLSVDGCNVHEYIDALRDLTRNPPNSDFDGFLAMHSRQRLHEAFGEVLTS